LNILHDGNADDGFPSSTGEDDNSASFLPLGKEIGCLCLIKSEGERCSAACYRTKLEGEFFALFVACHILHRDEVLHEGCFYFPSIVKRGEKALIGWFKIEGFEK